MSDVNRQVLRAVMKGDLEALRAMFAGGINPHSVTEKEGWNLLHQATLLPGHPASVPALDFLLAQGVDPSRKDAWGNTPLHYAARSGDAPALSALIAGGGSVNVSNSEGITPLHQALLQRPFKSEVVEVLLRHGAEQAGRVSEYVAALADPELSALFAKHQSQA